MIAYGVLITIEKSILNMTLGAKCQSQIYFKYVCLSGNGNSPDILLMFCTSI